MKKENKTLKEAKAADLDQHGGKAPVNPYFGSTFEKGGFPKVGAIEEATEEAEEEDSVTEIVYEGKKYLKSVISGVVYDMDENEIGTWKNDKIVFEGSEEEEEEYEN